MLTVMLIVVLGVGSGLFVLWVVEGTGTRDVRSQIDAGSLGAAARTDTAPPNATGPSTEPAPAGSGAAAATEGVSDPTGANGAGAVALGGYLPVVSPAVSPVTGPILGRVMVVPGPVWVDPTRTSLPPDDFVAVEGSFAEVAMAPRWRRILSGASLLVIVVLLGVVVAAAVGAAVAIGSGLLDSAIG